MNLLQVKTADSANIHNVGQCLKIYAHPLAPIAFVQNELVILYGEFGDLLTRIQVNREVQRELWVSGFQLTSIRTVPIRQSHESILGALKLGPNCRLLHFYGNDFTTGDLFRI